MWGQGQKRLRKCLIINGPRKIKIAGKIADSETWTMKLRFLRVSEPSLEV